MKIGVHCGKPFIAFICSFDIAVTRDKPVGRSDTDRKANMENRLSQRIAKTPATRISAEEAAGLVRSGMWLDYGVSLCQPDVFDRALAARAAGLSNVKIRSCLTP